MPTDSHLEDLFELLLLVGRQGGREFDVVLNNEIAALAGRLGDGEALVGVDVLGTGLRGAAFLERNLLAVHGADRSLPAGQGLFEIEVNLHDDVVAVAGVERVWLLRKLLATCRKEGQRHFMSGE